MELTIVGRRVLVTAHGARALSADELRRLAWWLALLAEMLAALPNEPTTPLTS